MFSYKIGYYSHEDSDYVWLLHVNKITDKELEAMVLDVAPEVVRAAITQDNDGVQFDEVYTQIADALCAKYDFKKVEIAAAYGVFGWADLCDADSWREEQENDKLLGRLGNKIRALVNTDNKKVEC